MICGIYRFCIGRFKIFWLFFRMIVNTTSEDVRGIEEDAGCEGTDVAAVGTGWNQPVSKEVLGTRWFTRCPNGHIRFRFRSTDCLFSTGTDNPFPVVRATCNSPSHFPALRPCPCPCTLTLTRPLRQLCVVPF